MIKQILEMGYALFIVFFWIALAASFGILLAG